MGGRLLPVGDGDSCHLDLVGGDEDVHHARIVGVVAVFVVSVLTITTASCSAPLEWTKYQGLLLSAVALGIAAAAVLLQVQGTCSRIPLRRWIRTLCWGLLPYAYAFGSSHNYWRIGAAAGIFWIVAGVTLLIPSSWNQGRRAMMPIAAATQLAVALILYISQQYPYRQAPRLLRKLRPI